jgi:RNA-directed DNA polymerase
VKNKEELPTNSDRGALQQEFGFDDEDPSLPLAELLRPELTDPALGDQPALGASSDEDALMELIVSPRNLERAWRQVKRNRGAPGPDGMTIREFESWARANWPAVRQQLWWEPWVGTTHGHPVPTRAGGVWIHPESHWQRPIAKRGG